MDSEVEPVVLLDELLSGHWCLLLLDSEEERREDVAMGAQLSESAAEQGAWEASDDLDDAHEDELAERSSNEEWLAAEAASCSSASSLHALALDLASLQVALEEAQELDEEPEEEEEEDLADLEA